MGTPSIGSAAQMALDPTSSFSSSSLWIDFLSETVTAHRVILDGEGIRGTRSRSQERTRTGPCRVGGRVTAECSVTFLDTVLKYVLGAGPSGAVYSLAEALPSFYLMIDRGAKVFTYGPCYVGRATFSASPADPKLKCALDIEAETESVGNSGTFPAGMTPDTRRPYVYSDLVLTILSNAYSSFGFELTIDNHLLADRFVNELTRSQIPAVDRLVTCKLTTPWTDAETELYNIAVGSFGSATAVFTNAEESSSVLTFTMPCLEFPGRSPNVRGKAAEIRLELDAVDRKSGSSAELSITNAHA